MTAGKPKTTEQRIADNLKAIRADNKLSQEKLAAAMTERGYSWHQATVYKVEQGERQVQLGEADALANILGVPLSDLLGSEAEATAAVRLAAVYRRTIAARVELIAAHAKWQTEQRKLAQFLDATPRGDKAHFHDALARQPERLRADMVRAGSQSVVDALDEAPF